jgi:hypothetical protein
MDSGTLKYLKTMCHAFCLSALQALVMKYEHCPDWRYYILQSGNCLSGKSRFHTRLMMRMFISLVPWDNCRVYMP